MSTNYLWSKYGVKDAGDDWNMAATPSYQGQTTAAFNADTFRILKDCKDQDAAFTVLTYLLQNEDLLKLYGGMPAVEAKQDAFLQSLQADYTQPIDWKVAKDAVQFADVPNFESYTPAYNETFDLIQKFCRSGNRRPASTSTRRSRTCASRCRPSGTRRPDPVTTLSAPAPAAAPGCRVWRGVGRAGDTSSSRRGSSGSSCSRSSR